MLEVSSFADDRPATHAEREPTAWQYAFDAVFAVSGLDDIARARIAAATEDSAFFLERFYVVTAHRHQGNRRAGVSPALAHCRFVLRSANGAMGDEQIFTLLRRIGRAYPWRSLDKIGPSIPAEVRAH